MEACLQTPYILQISHVSVLPGFQPHHTFQCSVTGRGCRTDLHMVNLVFYVIGHELHIAPSPAVQRCLLVIQTTTAL